MKQIALSLPISDRYGWGICGLELTKALNRVTGNQGAVQLFNTESRGGPLGEFVPLAWDTRYPYTVGETMLHAITGPTMFPINQLVWSRKRNIGLCFIEDPDLAEHYIPVANNHFDHIITGSNWCTEELRKRGFPSVSTAIQGVDTSVFHPNLESTPTDRFMIGSFGKFEYRKGQDIVIAAFKLLIDKHPDMHLVCGWGNLWPETMDSMEQSDLIKYCKVSGDWKTRCKAVLLLNGISSSRYTLLDMVPHDQMAAAYRGVHLGLAVSRCEAGTNLPAMEMMACGVPVIGNSETGQRDIAMGLVSILEKDLAFSPESVANRISEFRDVRWLFHRIVPTWDSMAESVLEYA